MQTKNKYKKFYRSELVAIDDAMGQILWTRHFLAAQEMAVTKNDNHISRKQKHNTTGIEWYYFKQ